MNKLFSKYIIFFAVMSLLCVTQKAFAGAAAASVFDMAEQYRPDKLRTALKNESNGASLSSEERELLDHYHFDESLYREMKIRVSVVCSHNEKATSYKYAEDPLPDCRAVPKDVLKQAVYVDANGSHYIASPEERAKLEKKMRELDLKWSK